MKLFKTKPAKEKVKEKKEEKYASGKKVLITTEDGTMVKRELLRNKPL